MKTYLVTGGAGFIGSNFIIYMLSKYNNSIEIINYDKLTYAGNKDNLAAVEQCSNYHFIKGDICDKAQLQGVFSNFKIDYCINFAAESHVDNSIIEPELFIKTNVLGTATLLNVAKSLWVDENNGMVNTVKKFVQISTDEVYGSLGNDGEFTECSKLDAHSPYSASKASADLIVKAYYDTYGMPVNITRCSNNYGPRQHSEKLIPVIIKNALHGESIPIYGNGSNVRDWIYVDDHVRAIDMVIHNGEPGEIYNIGGGNEKANIEMAYMIIDKLNLTLPVWDNRKNAINNCLITYVQDRKGHDYRYAVNTEKIRKNLGWRPEKSLDEGLQITLEWYLNNPEWLDELSTRDIENYSN